MFSPPGARLPLWLSTAHYLSRLHPWHRRLRAFLAEAPLLSASAKNRFGLRVDRLQPPLAPVLRDFPRKLRVHYGLHSRYHRHLRLRLRCRPASVPLSTRNLRLLFRAIDAVLPRSILHSHLRHTVSPVPPTHEEEAAYIPSPGHVPFIHRLRRYAHPRPRCAVRRCTDSTPAVGQPLHSLRVCLRLRARAGRHIVLVQAHDKVPVAPCLLDTCRLL